MDNQYQYNSFAPGTEPFNTSPNRSRRPITPFLIIILGLGTVIFGVLTIFFSMKAATATKTLNDQKAAAAAAARADQKKIDDDVHTKADEVPYRSFVAPEAFGSFVINFPKSWSSYLVLQQTGRQVQLTLNPDFVRRINSIDELSAMRVNLLEQPKDQYISQYTSMLKTGAMKQADVKVSGLPGYEFTGKFPDHRTVHEVVIPIRDKVITFDSEDAKYSAEFAQIIAQAKLIP